MRRRTNAGQPLDWVKSSDIDCLGMVMSRKGCLVLKNGYVDTLLLNFPNNFEVRDFTP